ncbi:hypothetical protein B0H17DRAFT_1138591 [Mycena rosella]|uniref:Uncharacterized protein n=1 Tax=Mycena rosella TaxID=1033263 RepID=A0AAD7D6S1_MYCRO|nr:hypothetical protein B0H17DRAFT_1138591 [Mycena rosella]
MDCNRSFILLILLQSSEYGSRFRSLELTLCARMIPFSLNPQVFCAPTWPLLKPAMVLFDGTVLFSYPVLSLGGAQRIFQLTAAISSRQASNPGSRTADSIHLILDLVLPRTAAIKSTQLEVINLRSGAVILFGYSTLSSILTEPRLTNLSGLFTTHASGICIHTAFEFPRLERIKSSIRKLRDPTVNYYYLCFKFYPKRVWKFHCWIKPPADQIRQAENVQVELQPSVSMFKLKLKPRKAIPPDALPLMSQQHPVQVLYRSKSYLLVLGPSKDPLDIS